MSTWNKKRRIMRRYDQSANVYDVQYQEEQETKIRTALANISLKRTDSVLDAGCGTGMLFKHVAEESKLLIGTDVSSGLLNKARPRATKFPTVSLIQADSDNLPLRNETFDTVLAITLLQNMPDPQATLTEIKRVTKQNGTVVVTGLKKSFTQQRFTEIIARTHLKVKSLHSHETMKDIVAICTKK